MDLCKLHHQQRTSIPSKFPSQLELLAGFVLSEKALGRVTDPALVDQLAVILEAHRMPVAGTTNGLIERSAILLEAGLSEDLDSALNIRRLRQSQLQKMCSSQDFM